LLTGLDILVQDGFTRCHGARIGVLANQCAVDSAGVHLVEHLLARGLRPSLLFGPEHGLWSTHQDMEPVEGMVDPVFGLPVDSLYGDREESLAPARDKLAALDVLLIDLQDIGTRYYTYAATVAKTLRVAHGSALRILLLDRQNPIDGVTVEGGLPDESLRSYVGELPVPHRHGLTLGELAVACADDEKLDVDLTVVALAGWDRSRYLDEQQADGQPPTPGDPLIRNPQSAIRDRGHGIPCGPGIPLWVPPSPNMPTVETAIVYPGLCLLEGTNVSEGRGTTTPFLLFGAPFVAPDKLRRCLGEELPDGGFLLTSACFRPQFGKWAGRLCNGLRLHVTDRSRFRPLRFGMALVKWLRLLFPGEFKWRTQAYEFVDDRLAIDLLLGHPGAREKLEAGAPVEEVAAAMEATAARFREERSGRLLYPRNEFP